MTCSLDVNILLYASSQDCPEHRVARPFLEKLLASQDLLCLSWATLSGYLRLVTNPAATATPLTSDRATENISALLDRPRTRVLVEEPDFWESFRGLMIQHRARGKLVPDVHLAALLRQHGVKTLYTHDRDFRRFDFLDVRDPLAT
ncbi:MAG: PIN domain-containing protein [Gemmatimonadales bacterium]|nr:PIN domain-containing protein [Gemmatimonadales bacterium]